MYPALYSFRRCPYAMRARMAIRLCEISYEHREILLRDKPQAMLNVSPKGTVPVLVTEEGKVIDESLDVMLWAIEKSNHKLAETIDASVPWVHKNDTFFKKNLDRFKYPNRYEDEGEADQVRDEAYKQAGLFLQELEDAINANDGYILSAQPSIADIAIFPFVRQFSKVDENLWVSNSYPKVREWLAIFLEKEAFQDIMTKQVVWSPDNNPLIIQF